MSKQSRGIELYSEATRSGIQSRAKSPQKSLSPNTSSNNHSSIAKIHKESGIHSISKVNSSALLKKKSLKRIKASTPIIGKSPSVSNISKNPKIISMLTKKSSLKNIENHLPGISSIPVSSYRSLTPNKLADLDQSQNSSIYNTSKKVQSYTMIVEKYEMFKGIFDEIIQKDKNFSSILKKIKEAYEEFYEVSIREHTHRLKEKNDNLNQVVSKKCEEIANLDRRIKKLSTENYELARSLERSEEICNGIQNRLNKISKFSLDGIERTDENWKALVIENQAFAISFKNLEKKLKNFKTGEKRFKKLLIEIKKTGFPIEEFYEKTIKKKHERQEPQIEAGSMTSDSGYIVSSRHEEKPKPEIIPELNLAKVEPESWSSSGSYSSYYDETSN